MTPSMPGWILQALGNIHWSRPITVTPFPLQVIGWLVMGKTQDSSQRDLKWSMLRASGETCMCMRCVGGWGMHTHTRPSRVSPWLQITNTWEATPFLRSESKSQDNQRSTQWEWLNPQPWPRPALLPEMIKAHTSDTNSCHLFCYRQPEPPQCGAARSSLHLWYQPSPGAGSPEAFSRKDSRK